MRNQTFELDRELADGRFVRSFRDWISTPEADRYTTHDSLEPSRIIPIGPELDFSAPHGRG